MTKAVYLSCAHSTYMQKSQRTGASELNWALSELETLLKVL